MLYRLGVDQSLERAYRSNIKKAYVFRFLVMMHFFAGVLIPFFTEWGRITFAEIMILQGIFTVSIFLMEVPTGAIADKFGRKISLALCGFVVGIAVIIYGSFQNFWIFAFTEFLFGTGFALLSSADQAIVYDSLRELGEENTSKRILRRYHSIGVVAIAIAAPIGSLIAKYMGVRYSMLLMFVPFFAASLVAMTFKEPRIGRENQSQGYFKPIIDGAKYLKGHANLRILVFDYVSISVLSFFIVWVYQYALDRLGVPISWFGFVCTAMTLSQVLVLNGFERLDRLSRGKGRYIFISAIVIGVSFIVMGVSVNVWLSIIMMTIISAFGITRAPLFQNYMNKFIDSHNRATVLSFASMLYNLSRTIAFVILGYMVEWNMRWTLVIIGISIIGFSLFSKVKEEHLLD